MSNRWKPAPRQHGTRRQILDSALSAERQALYGDVDWVLTHSVNPEEMIARLALRIRLISEALGYPSPWRSIPEHLLSYYETIETCWPLGITAEAWTRDDLDADPWPVPDEMRVMLRWQSETELTDGGPDE